MSNSNSDFNHVSHAPMATAISQGDSGMETHALKNRTGNQSDLPEKNVVVEDDEESITSGPDKPIYDHTHRQLKPRHVQLIGMLDRNIYMIIYSIYDRFDSLVLMACYRYWWDDWNGAIRPNRPNSTGRRPWQFIHSFYHMVSPFVPVFMLVPSIISGFVHFVTCFNGLEQSEVELRVYKYKTKGYTIERHILFLHFSDLGMDSYTSCL